MSSLLNKLFHLLAGRRYHRLFLLVGLLLALWGLKGLGQTAVFVHESVRVPAVVTDVTQKPFTSAWEALRGGDWKAEVAYYPHVNYAVPGGIAQTGRRLPDGDANDHPIGEQVEILTMPNDPTTAHLAAWKFIWGEPTVLFFGGAMVFLFGRLLRGRRGHRAARPARREPESKPARREPEQRREAPRREEKAPAPRRSSKKGQMELGLDVDEAPAKPKRKRKTAAADGAPKTPRKRKKKEA